MVGGGPGAGIAETHRTAMRLDDKYALVAGVFSRDPEKSLSAAKRLRIDLDRIYPDFGVMAEVESKRENDRIDAVVIVTRTDSHYEIAKKFLESGIHVICDKPLCLALAEAKELKRLADAERIDSLPHPQLLRLRDGSPCGADGSKRRSRQSVRGAGRTRFGMGREAAGETRAPTGSLENRSRSFRRFERALRFGDARTPARAIRDWP